MYLPLNFPLNVAFEEAIKPGCGNKKQRIILKHFLIKVLVSASSCDLLFDFEIKLE